jgi:hypothetical protein
MIIKKKVLNRQWLRCALLLDFARRLNNNITERKDEGYGMRIAIARSSSKRYILSIYGGYLVGNGLKGNKTKGG